MMRRISKLAFAWLPAVLALGFSPLLKAQAGIPPSLSGFAIGALPNPVGEELYTTITGVVFGSPNGVVPDGQIDFFISGDPTDCNNYYSDIGTGTISGGLAQISFYAFPPPGLSNTLPVCGNYTSASSGYAPATAGPFVLTIYQPTSLIVYVPPASLPGAALTFNVALTIPSGQPSPTGTITIQDPNNTNSTWTANVGTITVNGQSVLGATIPNVTLSGNQYNAIYNGDNNYAPQTTSGTIFLENPLTSISPASFIAGTSSTCVTGAPGLQVVLTGLGFTGNTTSQMQVGVGTNYQSFPVSVTSATQLTGCIPLTDLTTPNTLTFYTYTSGLAGGPVTLQVYAPFSINTTVTSTPSTFAYGANLTSIFNGTATRTAATDAAVPAGTMTFDLTRITGANGIPIQLGTGQLTQVSAPGTYQSPSVGPIDFDDTQKIIAADLNGDGNVDVVGLPGIYYGDTAAAPYLQVFISTGANSYQAEQQVFAGCAPQDFAVGDINGDNVPDLVAVCPGVTNSFLQAYYMLGNGDGTFQAPVPFGTGSQVSNATQVVIGWFNNDGFNNIAVVDGVDGYLQVISPFGANSCNNSTFQCDSYVYFYTGYGPVFSAAAADFNQDGLSDIVLGEYTAPSSNLESNGGVLSLINSSSSPGSSFNLNGLNQFSAETFRMWNMAVTDVNGDGYPDVLIADPGSPSGATDSGNVLYFQNDTTGNLPLTLTQSIPGVLAAAGAPFPIVGKPSPSAAVAPGWNILYAGTTGDNSDNFVTEAEYLNGNLTAGTTYDTGTIPNFSEGGVYPVFLVAADMNGDGYLDIATTGFISDDGAPSGYANELVPYYYGNDAQVALNNSSELPTPGNYSLGMSYPGNLLYQANNTATTTITVLQGAIDPSSNVTGPGTVNYGASFNLTANIVPVTGGALPTGTVTFYDGSTQLGAPVTLTAFEGYSGATKNVTRKLAAGTHTIYITYNGDADYLTAPDVASTPLQVNGTPFTLNLTTAASSGTATAGSMLNIQVTGQTVTGAPVIFPAGETVSLSGLPFLSNPVLTFNSSGIASFNYGALPPGGYSVSASYPGDGVYAAAQSAVTSFTLNPTPVTVTLSSSANPITYPATASLTANATTGGLGVPVGTIGFDDNGGQLNSASLNLVNGNSGLLASSANNPYAVLSGDIVIASVTGDFNHDGNKDIATIQVNSDSSATLVVALGNGDGTFQAPIVYGTTAGTTAADTTAYSIAVADFTGSGYADSLVISALDGNIQVFLYNGNASGILGLSQTLVSSKPIAVAAGDFTNNGLQDIAVISSASVSRFANSGGGAFAAAPAWTAPSPYQNSNFTGITVADLNHDGYADIAISDNTGATGPDVTVYLYDPGLATFAAPVTYPVGVSATAIASGNLNNDVYPDIAVLSNTDNTVDVLLNNQSGGFPAGTTYGVATSPTAIAIADFNGDGFADIAVSGNGTGAGSGTTVLLSSTTGVMTGEVLLPTTSASSVATADFNNDGNTDLAVGSTGATIFLDTAAQAVDLNQAFTAGTQPLTAAFTPLAGSTFANSTSSTLDLVVNQDVPVVNWTAPSAISYGTALSATQLDAAVTPIGLPGTLTYTPLAGTILTAGTHQLAVTFVPTDAVDYQSVSQFVNITVNPIASTVTWGNPAAITYPTALSATQLNATASVPGTFAYDPALGTVLSAGTHTLSVTFTPTDNVDYESSTGSVSITVNQATPTITWTAPGGITYGTALSATQLDATGSVPGVLTYNPAAGTVLTAGTHTLSVTLSPTDGTDYAAVTKNVAITVGQATPTVTWNTPAAITYGTALGAAQLDATASTPGTFTYNPVAGTVLTAGTHALGVTFTPTDTTDYTNSTGSTNITVSQATPTVSWTNPASIAYGTALSGTQLDATASVPGTFAYNPAAGTVLTAGTHTLNATFTPTDATDYASVPATATIVVSQSGTTITWANPAAIAYGTALSATQLNATASAPGTFTYNPPAGTVLTAGTHTLGVTFTPTDTTDYQSSTSSATIIVNQAGTNITWGAPAAINYGTALSGTQLNATASVPGTLAYNPPSGTVLTAGTHTLNVTFTPTDATDYQSSTASQTITVNQAGTTVTWGAPAAISYGTALSATQLNATASAPGTLTYNPPLGTILTAGTHQLTVNFSPTDTVDYKTSSAAVSITVNQVGSTITWNAPAGITYGTALSATQLNATASVPGAFAYNPGTGTVLGAGTHPLGVTFTPTDSVDYKSATASVNITVSQATPTITWNTPAAITYGTALSASQLNATASVPGTFTYNPSLGTVLTAGSHQLSVTFAPTDGTDYLAQTANVTIQVSQATSSITWNAPTAITYGTALSALQLNATASVAGTFTYNPAVGTVLTAGSHTLGVTFTPTDTTDYKNATSSVSIQVNQATPTITWATPASIAYGTALSATQLDATSPTAGTFTYNPAAGTQLTAGSHTLSVSFTPTDTTDYAASTGSTTILVSQATPVIIWPSPGSISFGTALGSAQLDATATPTGGTFTYNPPSGATLPVGTQTLTVTYTPTDTTDYATAVATTAIIVTPSISLGAITPNSAAFGSGATTITLTGLGFTSSSVVELNSTAIPSTYVSLTQMTAQIPASFFQQTSVGAITVVDPVHNLTTAAVPFTVTLPNLQYTFSAPTVSQTGEQPTINLALSQAYPVDITGTMTLSVSPLTEGGPTDPSVQFSTGGTSLNFTIPAGSTTTPNVQIQTGTLAADITITLSLLPAGQTTPFESAVTIQVPDASPVITGVTLARNGNTLTVTVVGYSSPRDMSSADFTFTAAPGSSISNPTVTVDVSSEFNAWYSNDASVAFGSEFEYQQVFNLNNDASTIGSVSVELTNSVGQSNDVSAQ